MSSTSAAAEGASKKRGAGRGVAGEGSGSRGVGLFRGSTGAPAMVTVHPLAQKLSKLLGQPQRQQKTPKESAKNLKRPSDFARKRKPMLKEKGLKQNKLKKMPLKLLQMLNESVKKLMRPNVSVRRPKLMLNERDLRPKKPNVYVKRPRQMQRKKEQKLRRQSA